MKILILDGFTLFQDDLSRALFSGLGEVIFRDRTSKDELFTLDQDIEVIITNKCVLGIEELDYFKRLKLVMVSATGYNCVDVKACKEKGIQVSNVPNYGTYSVAQHAMAMLLHYTNHVDVHDHSVRSGSWSTNKDWCYALTPIKELHGKTLGIIGMGNIGSCFASMAESMGMIINYHHTRDLNLANRHFMDLHTLAGTSNVISLHCPLNDQTDKIINSIFLSHMKSDAILINTSRGGLIDNLDLRDALAQNKIAVALLDVLDKEPPPPEHPLVGLTNAIITPHIAWISKEARERICSRMLLILESFIQGKPLHAVS